MRAGWLVLLLCSSAVAAQELPLFDFKDAASARQWEGNKQVSALETTAEGLSITPGGEDPFITGPARNYPAGDLLWLRMRIKSEKGGLVQVFYFEDGAREKNSIKSALRPGQWEDLKLAVPALGPGYRLRIDPPANGKTLLARIGFEPRDTLKPPANWPAPTNAAMAKDAPAIGDISFELVHGEKLGEFAVKVGGQVVAIGGNHGLIGYVHERRQNWIDLHRRGHVTVAKDGKAIECRLRLIDDDGAEWQIVQRFADAGAMRGINVQTQIRVSKDRAVAYLPILFLHPGVGTFGEKKTQAIFPGLEYLDRDEPSSSQKDITGPGSQRQVPDSAKITMPLMAVVGEDDYVGLIWEPDDLLCAVFDSPDRLYKSGGHVMGLLMPGSNPELRSEGNLMPSDTVMVRAGKTVSFKATIIGDASGSVMPALWRYWHIHGLPKVPDTGLDLAGYVRLASAGWLDSQIGRDGLYRHAFPGPFVSHPAADAVAMLDWLGARSDDQQLRGRLAAARKAALVKTGNGADTSSAVGHIRTPTPALLYGNLEDATRRAQEAGRELLKRFEKDGSVRYKSGAVDYGRTHFAPDANGLTANLVANLLAAGTFCGDRQLIDEGLRLLKALDRFNDTVPRGAQTWEIPLHTPDILAAAHLVRAYTLGYEISGDKKFLEQAEYWAWTGVPFVYLHNPTNQPIGLYSTIAVLGATNWEAPNWMGQPVQWCGLVYADALYRLAPYHANGPWKQLADGITASGIQQTWPVGSDKERQGLLPDAFMPRRQQRVDVCINPATLQVAAARLYRQTPIYSFHVLKGLFIHIPGEVIKQEENKGVLWMRVRPCTKGNYSMLVAGLKARPTVTINAAPPGADAVRYLDEGGRLIIKLDGESNVMIEGL